MHKIPSLSLYGRFCRRSVDLLNGESGLALPIVLAMLALGALVTGPFLAHASAASIGSANYGQMINETYTAEAGLEHGLWSLTDNNLAGQIPNIGDTVTYDLPDSVNNLVPRVSVATLSVQGSASPAGTITKPFIDSYQFDTAANAPVAITVATGICAFVYRDSVGRLILKTVAVAADGTITHSIIDSLTVAAAGYESDIVNIASGVYGIVYRGTSSKGYIATVQISTGGVINHHVIDQIVYSSNSYEPGIIHVSGEYYLVAYRGASNKGYAVTMQISNTGIVVDIAVSTYNFASTCYEPDITLVAGNYYVIVYRGTSNKGSLVTISVNANGIISSQLISTLIFNSTAGYTPKIIRVTGTAFVIAYRGSSNIGYLTTVKISTNGIISSPVIDNLIFDGSTGYEPDLIQVTSAIYAVAYRGPSSDGFLKTIAISAGGGIDHTIIDTYEFDTANGYEPYILPVSGDVYAIFYRGGAGSAGSVKAIRITNDTGISGGAYLIQSFAGSTTLTVIASVNNGLSQVTSWIIDR
jgi:hypothetical protein